MTCKPERTEKCKKAGTGPSCRKDPKYGNPKKKRCLDQVKEECEERLDQCREDCITSEQEKFQKDRDREQRAQEEALRAAAEASQKCQTNIEYKRALEGSLRAGRHVSSLTTLYFQKTNQAPPGFEHLEEILRERVAEGNVGAYDVGYLAASPGEILDHINGYNAKAEYYLDLSKQYCPAIVTPDFLSDPCEVTRRSNKIISRCLGGCHEEAISNCDTVHCYCDLLECPGPKMEQFAFSPPEPPGTEEKDVDETKINLSSLGITVSEWGIPIPLLWGRYYFPGNLIWISDVVEERVTETYQKIETQDDGTIRRKASTRLRINNYVSFHFGLCAGPVDAITRIWLDGALIYDVSSTADIKVERQDKMRVRVMTGKETNNVHAIQVAKEGFEFTPAYRGLAGVILESLNLTDLERFPEIRVEAVRDVSPDLDTEASAALSDTTSEVFYFDYNSRRIFTNTSASGVRVLNYDSLTNMREVAVTNPVESTSLPSIVTYDADVLGVEELVYGEAIGSTFDAINSATFSFRFRHVDSLNEGKQVVGLMTNGTAVLYSVDDLYGSLAAHLTLTDVLTGVAETATTAILEREEATVASQVAISESLFLCRSDGALLEVSECMMWTTDHFYVDGPVDNTTLSSPLIENGDFNAMTIEDEFDGTASLNLLGVLYSGFDKHLIFFTEFGGTFRILKWHPDTGVVWTTDATSLPTFGKYTPGRQRSVARQFAFVAPNDAVYRLDLEDGALTEVATGLTALHATIETQTYDDELGAVTYFSTDDTFIRLYSDRIVDATTSVSDVIQDLAERVGLQPSDIDTSDLTSVNIIGMSSGGSLTAKPILNMLFSAYPTTSFSANKLVFLSKSTENLVTIDQDFMAYTLVEERKDDSLDINSSTVSYISNSTAEEHVQKFSLPDDPFIGRTKKAIVVTMVLTDDYARQLAELVVFAAKEQDTSANMHVAPRFLNLTPSDIAVVGTQEFRVNRSSTGWDYSTQATEMSYDPVAKYANLVALSGIAGFGRFAIQALPTATPAVLTWPSRIILPSVLTGGGFYFAAGAVVGEPTDNISVSLAPDETDPNPQARAKNFDDQIVWGRLVTAPTGINTNYSFQEAATLVVKLSDPTMAARLEPTLPVTYTTLVSGYRNNLIWLGDEMLQYLSYSVAGDGVTVTLTGLMRNRQNTFNLVTHTAGQPVFFYEPNMFHSVDTNSETDVLVPLKFLSTSTADAEKRRDFVPFNESTALRSELGVWYGKRLDAVPSSPSSLYPANPLPVITGQGMVQHAEGFSDSRVNDSVYGDNNFGGSLYLLRADYDEADFATFLPLTSDYTYIMVRTTFSNNFVSELGESFWGYAFRTSAQDTVDWEAATEPLVAVFIVGDVVTTWKWDINTQAFGRPVRGLRNN